MSRLLTHTIATLAGILIGGGGLTLAAHTTNYPFQTWLGVQTVNHKIGTYGDQSPISIMGQLDYLRRSSDDAYLEAQKACRAAGGFQC
jgi:hypothetical protein